MSSANPFSDFAFGETFNSLLPDFVLAFAFFMALAYAVLGKRFDHQRSAVAASAAIGLALSLGLVWWEEQTGLSVRNLGPLAVGFAVLVLAGVIYQAIQQVGGGWAGTGIALGASLVVAWILGAKWPVPEQIIQIVITVALILGTLAFLGHHNPSLIRVPLRGAKRHHDDLDEVQPVMHDVRKLQEGHIVSDQIARRLRDIERQTEHLAQRPEDAGDAMLQIRRMLPAEGWLTERMAHLRERAYRIRQGHIARIDEIQHLVAKLPIEAKRKAAEELAAGYKELDIDLRMDRLDKAVAANEKHIRDLTKQAESYLAAHDYRQLHDALKAAEKLQRHNSKLFNLIDRTEARLEALANKIAGKSAGVSGE